MTRKSINHTINLGLIFRLNQIGGSSYIYNSGRSPVTHNNRILSYMITLKAARQHGLLHVHRGSVLIYLSGDRLVDRQDTTITDSLVAKLNEMSMDFVRDSGNCDTIKAPRIKLHSLITMQLVDDEMTVQLLHVQEIGDKLVKAFRKLLLSTILTFGKNAKLKCFCRPHCITHP